MRLDRSMAPAWHEALGASALKSPPNNAPGVRPAALRLRKGCRENNWDFYRSKLRRWIDLCTVIYPVSGHTLLCPCPAFTALILAHLDYVHDEGRVHHSSLQSYLGNVCLPSGRLA